jgi:basic membrane protein A
LRRLAGLFAAAVLIALVGCGPQKKEDGAAPSDASAGKPNGPSKAADIKAAMVTDTGGIGDLSFNAGSWEGLKKAQTDFSLPKPRYLESKELADYKGNLSTLAEQKNDIIFAVGFMMEGALKEVAPKYPDVKFAIIDGSVPTGADGKPLPNCVALKFREEEGCFLAGYLAAKMSKTGAIGFVGGVVSDLITKFEVGYIAGARTANPKIRVIVKYVGSWEDHEKAQLIAEQEFRDGADIIFHGAGKSGLGVLDAANTKGPGFYGIGVDKDQDHLHPGRVLTSMMKGVDTAVYDTVKEIKDGKWAPGDHIFGIKDGGIHLSPMKYTKQDVPADVLAKLDEISKQIAEGKIKPPTTQDELQTFQPPKV